MSHLQALSPCWILAHGVQNVGYPLLSDVKIATVYRGGIVSGQQIMPDPENVRRSRKNFVQVEIEIHDRRPESEINCCI